MIKRLTLAAVVLAATGSFFVQPSNAADGGGQCGGNLVGYKRIMAGNTVVGELQLYYNPANGNNCASTFHSGPTWGVSLDTGVALYRSSNGQTPTSPAGFERQNFRYQAGPIRTDGRNRCIISGGGITYQGQHYTVYTQAHCK
ncbi:hypothetical protein ASG67_14100 [Sphingomonas sp. Leaf339]|uniref:hypothetical protein n=1 Tax=Sphingomonas sp. Leaf339 TaxID=1736343 RepID=UPI0006F32303|nr:hypothetical protein [Sphingomonas sp. Leaf339]KQU47389.1 hypothetical protein ASG67_14100 [Sphingomonas sp. Leaf339]